MYCLLQAQENMREIHCIQEEKLQAQQVKEKANQEKTHTKSLKKLTKGGSIDQVHKDNASQIAKLEQDHTERVTNLNTSKYSKQGTTDD